MTGSAAHFDGSPGLVFVLEMCQIIEPGETLRDLR